MKYLLTYQYEEIKDGIKTSGVGSAQMNVNISTNKMTPEILYCGVKRIEEDLKNKGRQQIAVVPMVWCIFDGEEENEVQSR